MTVDLPLHGRKVVITRSHDQQSEANRLLVKRGASVLDLPALVIGPPDTWEPLDNALKEIDSFHWLVFSSANGVRAVQDRLLKLNISFNSLSHSLKIAAIGSKTAKYLEHLGVTADFVPPQFVADSLIEHFPLSTYDSKILIPRVQSGGRTVLADSFRKLGLTVIEVPAYESSCPKKIPEDTLTALMNSEVDAITFTSGKTAIHTAKLMEEYFGSDWYRKLEGVKLISIGPQTSLKCQQYFQRVDQEAKTYDLDGLINACINALNSAL